MKRPSRAAPSRALLCIALALAAGPARAQPPADPSGQASGFFEAGAQAYEAGQYAVAAEAFLKAHALLPSPALLFSAAQASRRHYLAEGSPDALRRAVALYRDYLRADPKAKRREDAMSALEALAPLEARLAGNPSGPAAGGPPDGRAGEAGSAERPAPQGEGAASQGGGAPSGGAAAAAAAAAARGGTRLLLTALPDSAEVSLDGGAFVSVPVVVAVKPGPHAVRVRATGYHDEQVTVRALPDELLPRHVLLRPKPARLVVRGTAGARVSVDGQVRGTVPTATPLPIEPGAHLVTVTLPGHEPYSRRVELGRDGSMELLVDLPLTRQRIAAWAVLSAGAAGAVAGGVLAGLALSRDSEAVDLREQRDAGALLPDARDRYNRAVAARDELALAAALTGGAAALTLVTGAGLFVFDHPEAPAPAGEPPGRSGTPAPRVDFTVGALSARLRVDF